MSARFAAACLLALAASYSVPAHALEVQFEGWYRARMRAYDSLSIDRDLTLSEGAAIYGQHRLWLKPRFLISDKVAVYTELRGLDGTLWGEDPVAAYDYVNEQSQALVFTDDLAASGTFNVWRAWGEVRSPYGTFSFGRMPLQWGLGVWQNDGLGFQGEHGDTADRLQWELLVEDVWVSLAFDMSSAGILNQGDDVFSGNATVGYRSERIKAGLNAQLRYVPDPAFTLFTIDGAVDAEAGAVSVKAEALGQFGSGDLDTGANDASLSAFGAVVDLSLDTSVVGIGLEGGLATGDKDPTDSKLRTFSFDRDYNVAAILFEQPMPVTYQSGADDGRNYDNALIGDTVSNAMYIKPRVYREIVDNLEAEVAFIGARRFVTPEDEEGRESYGMELDATVRYEAFDHVELAGTFGTFLPGTHFREYTDETGTYDELDETIYGGQVTARIKF